MKKALFIGYIWPEPNTTAAGHRMIQLIEAFLGFGYQVTFASASLSSEYSSDLAKIGVKMANIQLNHHSFDGFLKELNPEIVIFDRFMTEEQYGWRVAEKTPKAIRVLNTEDLHALRKSREECHKKGEGFTLEKWRNHPTTLREVASIYRSDCTLMISSYEMEILKSELKIPDNLLFHLPFMLDKLNEKRIYGWPIFEERKDFCSVGNGRHAPNIDSVTLLKKVIWPLIRKQLPNAKLHIYGAYLPQQVQEMHKPSEGFYVEGWAEDLDQILQKTRVVLAPLQFGAGIKGKLVDAMRNGTPTITTSIGSEGMHIDMPWNGAVCDDWKSFAENAIELYQNGIKWEQSQTNGVNIINTLYNRTTLQKYLQNRLKELAKNLETHRSLNFMGRLLQYQTLTSTKYLAKWIEAKKEN